MKYAVEVQNLSKTIKGKEILKDINFKIEEGKIIGLIGPNGSGKSTLLKVMTGLYKPTKGDTLYNGISLKNNFEKAIENVGCIIENPDFYNDLTGKENLNIFKSMFKGIDENIVKEIVKLVNIEKSLGKKFKTYSLGMKERLGLAGALINNPRILILDEPTNGLDPEGIKELRSFIKGLKFTTTIISSHLLSEIESLCDEVLFLKSGKIIDRKILKDNNNKKYIDFEVDDYSKAKLILSNMAIGESLKIYATDDEISEINKELVSNNIKVYRIFESSSNLEEEYFKHLKEGTND